jgi:hypothetical protein
VIYFCETGKIREESAVAYLNGALLKGQMAKVI